MARRAMSASGEVTEAAFQSQVIGLARVYGWRIFHAPDNRPAGKTGRPQRLAAPEGRGFPDLAMVKGARLIFAEVKTRTGRLGPGQPEWLAALTEVAGSLGPVFDDVEGGIEVYLWRPADWDTIHALLSRGQERRQDLDPPAGL